jgi:hypothetical protein
LQRGFNQKLLLPFTDDDHNRHRLPSLRVRSSRGSSSR